MTLPPAAAGAEGRWRRVQSAGQAPFAPQAHSPAQLQADRSVRQASGAAHSQGGAQVQAWQMVWSVIGTSWVSGCRWPRFRATPEEGLERKGYVIRSDTGATPNIRLKVRLKWAESAKPASWADCVNEDPDARLSTARVSLSHRR